MSPQFAVVAMIIFSFFRRATWARPRRTAFLQAHHGSSPVWRRFLRRRWLLQFPRHQIYPRRPLHQSFWDGSEPESIQCWADCSPTGWVWSAPRHQTERWWERDFRGRSWEWPSAGVCHGHFKVSADLSSEGVWIQSLCHWCRWYVSANYQICHCLIDCLLDWLSKTVVSISNE